MLYFKTPNLIGKKGYTYNNNIYSLIDNLAEVNGTDEMKYLTWTNQDVDKINTEVRKKRYGTPKKIELGETIVFNSPFGNFYTNQEVRVDKLEVVVDFVYVPTENTRYSLEGLDIDRMDKIKLKFYKINGSVRVIHEDSEKMYSLICRDLGASCKRYGWNWKGYYYFKESFGDIKYNHAITVHKSQGSTYKTSIINIRNIDFNKDLQERRRLMYTAITRASDLVILTGV